MKPALKKLAKMWGRFWMLFASSRLFGRSATWLAGLYAPPYYGRTQFAQWNKRGYIAPCADISHADLHFGKNIFIDKRVLIYQAQNGGPVRLGDQVHLYRDCSIQTGQGGSLAIGSHTYVQQRCTFSAYKGSIHIGSNVQIAPNCSFFSYNHGIEPEVPIKEQPLQTKGGIIIEDNVWLGVGAIILDGVRIESGAVIGAGSVVTQNIPGNAVVVGSPARVIRMRDNTNDKAYKQEMKI